MDANDFARRCLRRVTGQLSLEDQWIPALPDFLVELCEEVGIDPMPGALMGYFCEVYGVSVKQMSETFSGNDITIPDQPDADTLMRIFMSVPLTLLAPVIRIVDAEGKHLSPYHPDGSTNYRVTTCSVKPTRDRYPYYYHLCEQWRKGGGRSDSQDW